MQPLDHMMCWLYMSEFSDAEPEEEQEPEMNKLKNGPLPEGP